MNPDIWPVIAGYYDRAKAGAEVDIAVEWTRPAAYLHASGRVEAFEGGQGLAKGLQGTLDDPGSTGALAFIIYKTVWEPKTYATVTDESSGAQKVVDDPLSLPGNPGVTFLEQHWPPRQPGDSGEQVLIIVTNPWALRHLRRWSS
jgi:hypothetical protein